VVSSTSQPYEPAQPVTRISLILFLLASREKWDIVDDKKGKVKMEKVHYETENESNGKFTTELNCLIAFLLKSNAH
jgi:hypothetical protein